MFKITTPQVERHGHRSPAEKQTTVGELDMRLGLGALIAGNIADGRRGKNMQLPLPDLLRQSIYSRLAGYEDLNDAERL
jgi:hypothetical protein